MESNVLNQTPRTSWRDGLILVCSALAFLVLVTAPNVKNLLVNIPLVLVFFLGERKFGQWDSVRDRLCKKGAVALWAAYCVMTGWLFYRVWGSSGAIGKIAALVHIPQPLLVGGAGAGLSVASVYFVMRVAGLFLTAAGDPAVHTVPIRKESKGAKLLMMCFLAAFGTITVCSTSSFLYPMNSWVDANCFFTVGKSMMNGLVAYRDLFEHKGPFLYVLHALAWLISNDTFLGVYILEVIAATFFLYYSCKSASLFLPEKTAWLVIPVSAVLVYTSPAFCQGDSVEELCMPFLAYAVWVGFRALIRDEDISAREYLIIGICAGLVFWSKFIIVGVYIGWFIVPAMRYILKKEYKKLFRAVAMVALGVLISTVPFVIYFGLNNAIMDWVNVYLVGNLFLYNQLDGASSTLAQNMKMGINEMFYDNRVYYLTCVFGLLWFFLRKKDKPVKSLGSMAFLTWLFGWAGAQFHVFGLLYLCRKKADKLAAYVGTMLLSTYFFTYMGGQDHAYYAFVFSVFVPLGVVAGLDVLMDLVPAVKGLLKHKAVPAVCTVLAVVLAFWLTPNRSWMQVDRSELPQYQFKEIIEEVESPTLLNYGALDCGFYLTTNIVPNCKAFCKLNIPLEGMNELQEMYVREGLCDFVVTHASRLEADRYELAAESNNFYLYRLK